jgi:hypothetical protein
MIPLLPNPRLKAPQFIDGDERRVPLWAGDGEGNKARTNALDTESTMLYTESISLDETSSMSNRNVCKNIEQQKHV